VERKRYVTDFKRVEGLGAAHDGVEHWWQQRLSAVALVFLTPFFLFPFARTLGQGHEAMRATYGDWWNAAIAILFVITSMWHLRLGLQVVIEDYVHSKPVRTAALVANSLLSVAVAIGGVFAIAKIAFGA